LFQDDSGFYDQFQPLADNFCNAAEALVEGMNKWRESRLTTAPCEK
jgi:hypothetical protein